MGMECWLYKLSPKLTGKAQQAYAGMAKSELGDYKKVMATILRHYDITEESYRQLFQVAKLESGGTKS